MLLLAAAAAQAATPAYFWLSDSGTAPPGPEAATFNLSTGASDTLYLWARPVAGKKIRSLSLNLVADSSGVDFDDGGYTVHNAISASVDRFQFVHDSSSTPALESEMTTAEVSAGGTDSLLGIQGFTITGSSGTRGMGAGCLSGATHCHTATDGSPAWLLGEIDFNATTAGTVNLRLQIGSVGILHETVPAGDYNFSGEVESTDLTLWIDEFGATALANTDGNGDSTVNGADYAVWRNNLGGLGVIEAASSTEVVFGVDTSADTEPMHNASTDRSTNLTFDDPDAVITITAPGPALAPATPEPTSLWLLGSWVLFSGSFFARWRANQ